MFDFLTGFLLGIIFTIGMTVFGIYKLLLRQQGDERGGNQRLPHYPSLSQMQFNRYIKHAIPKHTVDETEVTIESCAWLNTVAAAMCVEALSSPVLVENLHKKLHDILNKPEDKPDVLGKIVISDINMGTGLPLVDGIRVLSRAHDDTLNAEIALRYNGGASFTISTELWVNWPTPKFASLPVSLHASFDHFEGTLMAVCRWYSTNKQRVAVYLRAPPVFQLRIGSTIGHTTKLVNVLQVSNMLENMIYSFVNKELVAPNGFELELEEGKVTSVRKLAAPGSSVPKMVTAGGEKKEIVKGQERGESKHGDLSRRSFSVSTTS
jgi:hypothetical protein